MKTVLVTGTDTGVGKTWVTSLLIQLLNRQGICTGGYKPVCSGAEFSDDGTPYWTDVESLRRATEAALPREKVQRLTLDLFCPQRFLAAVAPNVAAAEEQKLVDDQRLHEAASCWAEFVDMLVVEGAGGLFCPLSESSTVLDLAVRLDGPVVVVAANRLGVISHTRLTVEVLQSRGLKVAAIVLNEHSEPRGCDVDVFPGPEPTQPTSSHDGPAALAIDPSVASNADQIRYWIPDVPLFHCSWQGNSILSYSDGDQKIETLIGGS